MSGQSEEDRLWVEIQHGNPQAFEVIFDRYANFVYSFAFRRTGSWQAAEEIVGSVFLEAWRQRESVVTRDGSIRPWLIGVALNLIRRHWRQTDRLQRASMRLAAEQGDLSDHAEDVADRLDAEDRMARILKGLSHLPIEQREVLELWAWERLSYEDISSVLEIPVGTVRSRLHRARERLQSGDGTDLSDQASTDDTAPEAVVDLQVGEKGACA